MDRPAILAAMASDDMLPVFRHLIELNSSTGEIVWKPRSAQMFGGLPWTTQARADKFNDEYAWQPALNCSDANGRKTGNIFGKLFHAHRVVYAMCNNVWPVLWIDHINGDPSDNRPENLREVTPGQNAMNRGRQVDQMAKFKGIAKNKYGWTAAITADGRKAHLGSFSCQTAAALAYDRASLKLHGGYGRTNMAIAGVSPCL